MGRVIRKKRSKIDIETCISKWLHKNQSSLLTVKRDKIDI